MIVRFAGYELTLDETAIEAPVAEIERQLTEYCAGSREHFSLEVAFDESFTGAVMRAMAAIPYGETRTYGALADELDTSPIAVGQACGRNPVPIVVPCHRVVGADGLGGYSAGGDDALALKRALLDLEGASYDA